MNEGYIKIVGIAVSLMSVVFVVTMFFQYIGYLKSERGLKWYRIQIGLNALMYMLMFLVLLNDEGYSNKALMLFGGELVLLFVTNWIIGVLFSKSMLPLWSISQYLMVIGLIIQYRLNPSTGLKHFYMAVGAYVLAFLVAFAYHKMDFIRFLGIPAIFIAVILLLMTNSTINGANNWLVIGSFSFQPSEPVKLLYILFLASVFVLFKKYRNRAALGAGVFMMILASIQVFQKDLGSALIYYVVFILMCYIYTTNRLYIIGGGIATVGAGYFAFKLFSHVRVRMEAWLDPWSDINDKGYQIAQSLFAIGNGGITGAGLTLGEPNRIPVVSTDFIYSAIVEEMGIVVGVTIIIAIVFFFMFGIIMLEQTRSDFDFLLGSGLLIVYGFQSFLIIGGVTRAVPLTGVTLPFVSYGGSSMFTTFILLGMLQGIKLSIKKHKQRYKKQQDNLEKEKTIGSNS